MIPQMPKELEWALSSGHLEVVNTLRALEWAADNGHLAVVNTLLANGATPDRSPQALEMAAGEGHLAVVNALTNHTPPLRQPDPLLQCCRASIRARLVERYLNANGQPLKLADRVTAAAPRVDVVPVPAVAPVNSPRDRRSGDGSPVGGLQRP